VPGPHAQAHGACRPKASTRPGKHVHTIGLSSAESPSPPPTAPSTRAALQLPPSSTLPTHTTALSPAAAVFVPRSTHGPQLQPSTLRSLHGHGRRRSGLPGPASLPSSVTRTTTPLSAHACPFEPRSKAINEPTSLTAPTRPPLHITVTELDSRACCVRPSTTTPNSDSFELKESKFGVVVHDPQQKPDNDKSDGGTHLPSWLKDPRQRRAVQRVFRQLVAHYQDHPTCPGLLYHSRT